MKGRKWSAETRKKHEQLNATRVALLDNHNLPTEKIVNGNSQKGTQKVLLELTCKNCQVSFYVYGRANLRKTCSKDCAVMCSVGRRKYQNGSRKPEYYYNKWQNQQVLLDSSWELKVAKELDKNNVMWYRPEPMRWVDQSGKSRLYYPDFYIPSLNVYLDPKNPYCMKMDEYKMTEISKNVNIKYGHIDMIMEYIKEEISLKCVINYPF